jgi:2-polyprenyl-3-methyl-5-hydroxy-6-metoxy-1,4-benzoquinol methylase
MNRLAEQRRYYEQRAPEYDQWWQARGRYTNTPEENGRWLADVDEVQRALDVFAPVGEVLELAAGTGWWTERLARHATTVTAVDAARETLEVNRRRTAHVGTVAYLQADLFDWVPPRAAFDVVFFGYWLSHLPDERLPDFWEMVATALRPGGRVFVVDSYHPQRLAGDVQHRTLNDGRRFTVIKRFWQADELTAYTATLGWRLTVRVTCHNGILYAHGTRTP